MSLDVEDYNYQDMLKLYKITDTTKDNLPAMSERLSKIRTQFPGETYLFYRKIYNLLQVMFYFIKEGKLTKGYDRVLSQLMEKDMLELYPSPTLTEEIFPSPPVVQQPVIQPIIQSYVNPISPGDLNIVRRMTQTMNLNLNSCFRANYYMSSATDFMYTLPSPIKNVVSMRLASIELPNAWYLSRNNKFSIQHNCALYEVCIPDGNYDMDTIQEMIQSVLPPTIKFSINPISFHSEFSVEGTASFYFSVGDNLMTTAGWLLGILLGIGRVI